MKYKFIRTYSNGINVWNICAKKVLYGNSTGAGPCPSSSRAVAAGHPSPQRRLATQHLSRCKADFILVTQWQIKWFEEKGQKRLRRIKKNTRWKQKEQGKEDTRTWAMQTQFRVVWNKFITPCWDSNSSLTSKSQTLYHLATDAVYNCKPTRRLYSSS